MTGVVANQGHPAKPGTVVFDLDGVLYLDRQGITGAGEALRRLQAAGIDLVFATNNSTKGPESVAQHIEQRTGFLPDQAKVVTSGMATAEFVSAFASRCLVLGAVDLSAALESAGLLVTDDWMKADAVVVGLDTALNYRRLSDAVLAVSRGARFVATNVDATYPAPEGLLPGGGAITAAVEAATGIAPVVCGKPHPPMRRLVRALITSHPVLVVGDRPETDLAMAAAEGWGKVLVLSGVHSADDAPPDGSLAPDDTLGSVAELPELFGLDPASFT